jgi:hypothetical protein
MQVESEIVMGRIPRRNMTGKRRSRAIMSANTQKLESKMCSEANAMTPSKFWTPLEIRISESEANYERRMVELALEAARRKGHIEP